MGRFCIKSGPFTSRKQATNSLKLKQCDYLNKQALKCSANYHLKHKTDKKLRFSGAFQLIVNIIPQNLIKVRKYLHAFLPGIYKNHTFSSYNSKNIGGGSELSKQKTLFFF